MTDKTKKPSEARREQRRQQKGAGRSRRAEMLLDKRAKERARQDALEEGQETLHRRLNELEDRLAALEERVP